MFSVILVVEESHFLLSLRLEIIFNCTTFNLFAKSAEVQKLCSYVAIGCLVPDFSGIFCVLIDVFVEFVCLSESGLWLMTTQETIFSTCKELILISIQHLPQNRVTYTSSAGPMTVLSSIILIWLASFGISRICVLSSSCHFNFQLTWTVSSKMFVRLRLSLNIQFFLKLFTDLSSGRRWACITLARCSRKVWVTCCINSGQDQNPVLFDASSAFGCTK